ncbi:TonB-dependent receptor [Acidipila rosea]|uniref:Carboxypeptidase family protein n=1 Tax=Acidipila rosea TaxID=768535 RepID=A0A4R1L8Q4_9BACT|nr:TonB-dependent receptor [Acidipila rosea]TCK72739.1 carboxypeptidase family protein [Acidipila rosea]
MRYACSIGDSLCGLGNAIRRVATSFALVTVPILFIALLSTGLAHAQTSTGITGTVTDSSGAVISNAKVTIKNVATGTQTQLKTSSSGVYTTTGLLPGKYTVTVEATGFKKSVQTGINVDVTVMDTVNVMLSTGSTSETVEVTASAISLNTTQPQMGTTIEPEVVKALPVVVSGRGRQIDALQFLAPGVNGSSFSHEVNGGVDFEQEVLYNGIPYPQSETEGYTTNVNPPYELINEFHVEQSTFAAQYGLGQGAITYQTAGGTNQFHGDVFEINRNSFFDSKGFFNDKVPTDHENNYGFTVGGPVWLPKLYNGRDRTFFHFTYEWFKQNSEDTDFSTVPTALEKGGDFSDFKDSAGNLIPIYDPQTGKPFPGNVIPANRISALAQTLTPYLPDPDKPGLDSNKSYVPFVNPHIQHNWGYVIDHNLTATQSLHFTQWRDSFSNYSFDNSPFVIAPNPLNSMKFEPALGSGFLLNYTNTVTPNLVATAGMGWFGEINDQYNQTKYSFPGVQNGVIPPNITFDGLHAPTSWGTSGSWLQSINRKLGIAIVNNWLWSHGRNTFNIGGEARRSYQDDNEEQTAGGHFAFSQRTTSVPDPNDPNFGNYGSAFASFLLGQVDAANRSFSQELKLRNFALSPYIQDDIKMSPKLTINLGLRWDIMVPFTENNNTIVFFDPTVKNPAADNLPGAATKFGSCAGCAGYNRADIQWRHFGPRVGFAYQINDKTVVQGGFSIAFLDGGAYEYGTNKVAVNYGNLLVGSFSRNSSGTNTPAFGSWDANQLIAPPPTPFSPSLGVGTQIDAFSRTGINTPYSQQWNVNLQRELPWQTFLTVAWIGNREIHLPSQLNRINTPPLSSLQYGSKLGLNFADGTAQAAGFTVPYANFVNDFGASATVGQALEPFPQYSNIFNNFETSGTAYYESGQVAVQKRFTSGLSFLVSYVLSKTMSNGDSGFSSFVGSAENKYNQKQEWAVDGHDEPNVIKASGTYELPIGPGKSYLNNKGITGELLGGFQVGWILDYESGTPFGPSANGSPWPNTFNRPNRISAVHLKTNSYNRERDFFTGNAPVAQMFNPAAFAPTPTQYVFGDASRNYSSMRNAAFRNEDLNVAKHFAIGSRVNATLQMDYFNALNRTQFQGPDTNINHGSQFGTAYTRGSNMANRQGQIQMRLEF